MKRSSDLHLLDIRYMAQGDTKVVFQLADKPKHWRKPGTKPDPIEFFASGEVLCPVKNN